jgi:hypothetical protein
MMFIKATGTDGETEIFNLDKVINITPLANGTVKILMGAGLHWRVYPESIELIDCYNELHKAITEGK